MGYYDANAASKYCETCKHPTAQYYAPYGGIFKGPLVDLSFSCKACAMKGAIKRYEEIGYSRSEAVAYIAEKIVIKTSTEVRELRRKEIKEDNEREAAAIDIMLDHLPIPSDPKDGYWYRPDDDICPDCGGSLWDVSCRREVVQRY